MDEPLPYANKSGAVTAAAVIALLGSLLTLLFTLLAAIGMSTMQTLPQDPSLSPADARRAAFVGLTFIAMIGLWGLASSIGLFRYRNWARVSTLIWSALAVVFGGLALLFVSAFRIPVAPDIPEGTEAAVRIIVAIFYLIPVALGIWWLVLFTRKPIVALFQGGPTASIATGTLLDPSGFPAVPPKLQRPVPVLVVAWFLIVSAFFSALFLLIQQPPMVFFGRLYGGSAGTVFFVVATVITLCGGLGLLRMRPWAFWLAVGWQAFSLLNGTVTLLNPNYHALMKQVLAASRFANPEANPFPPESFRFFGSIGLLFVAAVLVILLGYRSYFCVASSPPKPS